MTVIISTGDQNEVIKEKRKILYPKEEQWIDIEKILASDIPDVFDMDVLTKYLSMAHVLLDGENYSFEVGKPSRKGRDMYFSKSIKRAWFCKSENGDFLLFHFHMAPSMNRKERR